MDSVPGRIGLTAWLNRTYSALGQDVIGGEDGMLEGFQTVLPNGGDILVSQESATYRPELEWLARQLNKPQPSSRAEPRDPEEVTFKASQRDSSTSLGMTKHWRV